MMKRFVNPLPAGVAAFLMALTPVACLAAQEGAPQTAPQAPAYVESYHIHFLDMHAAEQLAWDQCAGKSCRVSWHGGDLEVSADAATQEKLVRALTVADAPRTQSFQLTLLTADNRDDRGAGDLPKAAQKALQDLKDFLPFKGYRLLDMAWLRTTGNAEAHLAGDGGTPYSAELQFRRIGDPAAKELLVERFVIRAGSGQDQPAAATGAAAAAHAKDAAAAPHEVRWQDLIKTTFGMHVGETVVVGTSKLGGDSSALVVLLTAVP
jgi:hypothetical protein